MARRKKTKTPPLTKAKADHALQFKRGNVSRGQPLNPNAAIAARYYARLDKLVRRMVGEYRKEVKKLLKQPHAQAYFQTEDSAAMDAPSTAVQAKKLTDALNDKFQKLFDLNAEPLADDVMDQSAKASSANLHTSLKELSGGLSLKTTTLEGPVMDVFKASVAENVSLIKSIAQKSLADMQGAVMRSITTGNGLQDLVPFFARHEGVTLRRARNIANDQTRKAYNSLNKARMQQIGVRQFEWLHTGGSREPRPLHVAMSGNIYDFDHLPVIDDKTGERGIPGQLPNCFTGDTEISLGNGCLNIWRYWHDGPVVTIMMEGGARLTCTPNHPIRAAAGWVRADEIQEGDNLVCCDFDDSGIVDAENTDIKTSFTKLFHAFEVHRHTSPGAQFNFHGDIPKGDVDCISAGDLLSNGFVPDGFEKLAQFALPGPDGGSLYGRRGVNAEVFHAGRAGVTAQGPAFLGSHDAHTHFCGPAGIAQDDPLVRNDACDDLSRNTVSSRQGQNAIAVEIIAHDGNGAGIGGLDAIDGGDGVAKPRTKRRRKSARAASKVAADRVQGIPPIKRLLRVEKKSVSIFSGHVYTMETVTGWYGVASAGVVCKNCRCRMVPVIKFNDGEPET